MTPTSSTGQSRRARPARPSSPSTTAAGHGSGPGCARGGSCRPTPTPSGSADAAGDPAPRRRPPCRDATGAGLAGAGPLRARPRRRAAFRVLSGGQQARFQILMLELSGATLLLLDEPTDNLDVESAEALEGGLEAFAGTVLAVTQTAGSPVASTASWSSVPTARSTSPTSRSGTSDASNGRAERRAGAVAGRAPARGLGDR